MFGTGIHKPALEKPDCVGAFSLMGDEGGPPDEPVDDACDCDDSFVSIECENLLNASQISLNTFVECSCMS